MTKSETILAKRPIHYACVSGGKDSLYMLNIIFNNLDKYPLEMVVHYELEIDHKFVKTVTGLMEQMCKKIDVPFVRIKPRKSWCELYQKKNAPTRAVRWCNSNYKLDCEKQLKEWIKEQNCRPVAYIGLCADETKRFKYEIGNWELQNVCYPLAEEGIEENTILEWARTKDVFDGWYKIFDRQGCWLCPNSSRLELAWLYEHEPIKYNFFYKIQKQYEKDFGRPYWGAPPTKNDPVNGIWADDMHERIVNKWLPRLKGIEYVEKHQLTFDELLGETNNEQK